MSSSLPNRDKLLVDLIDSAAGVTMALSRAIRYGVEFNPKLSNNPSEVIINSISEFNQLAEELIKQLPRPTIPYMTKITLEDFDKFSSERYKEEFITTEFTNLVVFMSSLGESIIDKFNLLVYNWKPQVVDGIDISPNNPYNLALTVIQAVWRNLQDA